MFLVATADERTWKKNEKILFLGEWCKLYSRKEEWDKLDYKVLPYHWDDRKKLYKDYLYLSDLYEKILIELSQNLNDIHSVEHSIRYWRIILGGWLFDFIQVLFDRYECIKTAIEYEQVKNTLIVKKDEEKYLPYDYWEFGRWASEDDSYNCYLFSRIIENLDCFHIKYIELNDKKANDSSEISGGGIKQLLRRDLKQFRKYIKNYFNGKYVFGLRIHNDDLFQLLQQLDNSSCIIKEANTGQKKEINQALREKICLNLTDKSFLSFLRHMIPYQIPSIYIEGYADLKKISLRNYPSNPRLIFNDIEFYANETFKFWAANSIDKAQSKFYGIQHGGLYGCCLWSSSEDFQRKIYDQFYTWGWEDNDRNISKKLPLIHLNEAKRKIKSDNKGNLLLVSNCFPRYSYSLESMPISSTGNFSYFKDCFKFVRFCKAENRALLLVRMYLHDYLWCQKERWGKEFPDLEFCNTEKSIINQLNSSRLHIGTYNGTSFLETFVADYPTILFWNPDMWELRPSAKPYFKKLFDVGILHYSPEKAAQKVNEISEDPRSWWMQTEIQEAKDLFCHQFARTSESWLQEWVTEFKGFV